MFDPRLWIAIVVDEEKGFAIVHSSDNVGVSCSGGSKGDEREGDTGGDCCVFSRDVRGSHDPKEDEEDEEEDEDDDEEGRDGERGGEEGPEEGSRKDVSKEEMCKKICSRTST